MEDRFTEAEIFSYIVKNGLAVDAKYVYDYWKKKGWNTKKGEPVKTLAAAVHVCNSIYLTILKNEMQTSKKHQRDLEEAKLMYDEYNKQLQSKEWEAFRVVTIDEEHNTSEGYIRYKEEYEVIGNEYEENIKSFQSIEKKVLDDWHKLDEEIFSKQHELIMENRKR